MVGLPVVDGSDDFATTGRDGGGSGVVGATGEGGIAWPVWQALRGKDYAMDVLVSTC